MEVWTDGCANGNGSGWAVIIPSHKLIFRGDFPGATNQQAELGAIIQAVYKFGTNIVIYTDSMYAMKCFSEWCQRWLINGWKDAKGKPVKNRQLIKLGLQLGANKVKFVHVRAHQGNIYNEMADYYCKNNVIKDVGWNFS